MKKVVCTFASAFIFTWPAFTAIAATENERLNAIRTAATAEQLKDIAVFTFGIMSDNKGEGLENSDFVHCVNQLNDLGAEFIVALGDNLSSPSRMGFLNFTATNYFWQNYFWPNIADGENNHYTGSQATWGGGQPILYHFGVTNRSGVIMATNDVDYYIPIPISNVTIHLTQLTFSDQPWDDPAAAFRADTRQFMVDTLEAIDFNSGREITVVCAHSRSGQWINELSTGHKSTVLSKCDIALAATSHFYKRAADHGSTNTLELNTGHCGAYNTPNNLSGFVACYVIDDPLCILTMYTPTSQDTMFLQPEFLEITSGNTQQSTYVKFIDSGKIYPVELGVPEGTFIGALSVLLLFLLRQRFPRFQT